MAATETARFALLPVDQSPDRLETELLARWRDEGLFEQVQAARSGGEPWVFYEGPPTANGKPGIHHVFARTIKDLFCRHRAMQGRLVDRKAGWDTHGLPVEIEVEKRLGIKGKQDIERLGVEEFNRLCRESVFTYREDWQRLSERIAFWLDYEHPYATYTNDYVESVWWALSTLHGRGLLYRGHKILPYCSRCGTSLSSHELALGYQDVDDPSVYIALDIGYLQGAVVDDYADLPGRTARRILVWTTTPWTLVSNAALAVNPELRYVELRKTDSADTRTIIMAEARTAAVLGDDFATRWTTVGTLTGADLVGGRYRRPLDWLPYPEGTNHEIIVGESFVSADDGSGVVHMSPAFGADDYAAGRRHDLAFLLPVDAKGEFPADLPLVGGKFVKDADAEIIEELGRRGVLWKAGTLNHSYPHCWRCGTPLLYYARTSWFVRTSSYRDEMMARNAAVNWNPPEVGSGRFGEWLENNIDWAVSRDRFWGTPLPVWVCDADAEHLDVVGSYAALASRSGADLAAGFDPHKPFIDAYTWPCTQPGCTGTMHRTPEVIDAWFDSGSMPFAQWHFMGKEASDGGTVARVASHFPADYIAEGQDQTRGWFYSLLAIATGLGDALPNNADGTASPYRSVVVNSLVLDAEGKKMSKSRGNIVEPWAVIERHGVDATRLFFCSSSKVWEPRSFDQVALSKSTGRFLLTIRNIYNGIFAQYANFGWEPSAQDPAVADRPILDRWVLARLRSVEGQVDELMTRFDATAAVRTIMSFVDEDVSNWYVRQTRGRFYDVTTPDNRAAFATLHEVLVVSCRLLAPFAPFLTDWLHRQLVGPSVHLAPYVRSAAETAGHQDAELEAMMGAVRTLATLGRSAREQAGINVRQPLARMVCVAPRVSEPGLREMLPVLAAELNIKAIELATSGDALVTLEAKPNFRALGRKFGKRTPLAAEAVTRFTSEHLRAFESGTELLVTVDGETHGLGPDDVTIVRRASGDLVVQEEHGFFAAIDPAITPALRREGLARELISRVQRMRKDAGLSVSDRIRLSILGDAEVLEAAEEHRAWIADEVLARALEIGGAGQEHMQARQAVDLDGIRADLALTRDDSDADI
ncbi:MAG: Isoleucyl-tRNA synthetase [Gemmatimonadetes bacterium]|nr:Isoleucyl-tRNA synthetase [Gemmatimonadota bacterium]